jgi:hypothetical protein
LKTEPQTASAENEPKPPTMKDLLEGSLQDTSSILPSPVIRSGTNSWGINPSLTACLHSIENNPNGSVSDALPGTESGAMELDSGLSSLASNPPTAGTTDNDAVTTGSASLNEIHASVDNIHDEKVEKQDTMLFDKHRSEELVDASYDTPCFTFTRSLHIFGVFSLIIVLELIYVGWKLFS